jgi:hypothetical protein
MLWIWCNSLEREAKALSWKVACVCICVCLCVTSKPFAWYWLRAAQGNCLCDVLRSCFTKYIICGGGCTMVSNISNISMWHMWECTWVSKIPDIPLHTYFKITYSMTYHAPRDRDIFRNITNRHSIVAGRAMCIAYIFRISYPYLANKCVAGRYFKSRAFCGV